MKIFTGGIVTETNSFAPFPTSLVDYQKARPDEILASEELLESLGNIKIWVDYAREHGWEYAFGLTAFAQPAGLTIRASYEQMRTELLEQLQAAMPVDAVLLDLHGAMVAQGYDDCEEDMVQRVRAIVGPDVVIGVELDLHCHLSQPFIDTADIVVIYKEYPHTDTLDRARELIELVHRTLKGEIKPTMALYDCRMIGMYRTTFQPMRSFVDEMIAAEGKDGVLSLSLGHGFPWGDVPHVGTRMLAVTDNNLEQAQRVAEQFGKRFFDLRHGTNPSPLHYTEAIRQALQETNKPVVIADITDNPGGGAPSDSTFLLRELLNQDAQAGFAMVWDPIVVQIAKGAGKGAILNVRLGGKMGPISGDPLDLQVEVIGVIENMQDKFFQTGGDPIPTPCGDSVALRCKGVDIIVNSQRTQVLGPAVFENFGIDIHQKQILVVKSTQHFYAMYSRFASRIMYADAPGALQSDVREIPYTYDHSRKFPWIDNPFAE